MSPPPSAGSILGEPDDGDLSGLERGEPFLGAGSCGRASRLLPTASEGGGMHQAKGRLQEIVNANQIFFAPKLS